MGTMSIVQQVSALLGLEGDTPIWLVVASSLTYMIVGSAILNRLLLENGEKRSKAHDTG